MLPELNGNEHSERVQAERQLIDKALLTCAELLEAENKRFAMFLAFLDLLCLLLIIYTSGELKKAFKNDLNSENLLQKNQLFLILVILKLNLRRQDLVFRFGLSVSQVSHYITTWMCFLYQQLKEIDSIPSFTQVYRTQRTEF